MRRPYRKNVIIKEDFSIDHLLIHDMDVLRKKKVRNDFGGYEENWVKVNENPVACRFSIYTPRDTNDRSYDRDSYKAHYIVFTLADVDLKEGDRIEFQGEHYLVMSPPMNPSFRNHHLETQVKLVPKEV